MDINLFLDTLIDNKIDFFTGVPDSLLGVFCDGVYRRFGVSGQHHIIAHNEGGCVALACGHYLASGRPACVYMQNSGTGNALNPAVSLAHPKVYGIPVLYVIGWRGEPGHKDEPQHIYQGEVTLKLLSDMDIEYTVIDKDTEQAELDAAFTRFTGLFREGKSAVFVVRKGAFTGGDSAAYGNSFTLNRERAIEIILDAAGDDPVVSTTGKISRELFELREANNSGHAKDFLTVGSMGHASMIALGIALKQPERRVWCLDGDGAVLMHMGALGIIGAQEDIRFIHVVFNNAAHDTVGGMPTVADKIKLCDTALACGYRRAFSAADEHSLVSVLEEAKKTDGQVFIEVKTALGSRKNLGRPTTGPQENKRGFMRFLSAEV